MSLLSTAQLALDRGGRTLYRHLDLEIRTGEVWAVLGPNGTGKSSLLQQLTGLLPSPPGAIRLAGRALEDWPSRELARFRALILQEQEMGVPMRVWDRVLLGCHPHLGLWGRVGAEEQARVQAVLATMDLSALAGRLLQELSGGERQRVALAAAMVQAPRLWLADEPNNHLDPRHQLRWMEWLRQRVITQAGAAIVALHDVNLAARFCDRILLLFPDGNHIQGDRRQVLQASVLTSLYDCPVGQVDGPGFPVFYWGRPGPD